MLTSSMQSHCEYKVEEIDRQTGAVVNELKLQDIIKCNRMKHYQCFLRRHSDGGRVLIMKISYIVIGVFRCV